MSSTERQTGCRQWCCQTKRFLESLAVPSRLGRTSHVYGDIPPAYPSCTAPLTEVDKVGQRVQEPKEGDGVARELVQLNVLVQGQQHCDAR